MSLFEENFNKKRLALQARIEALPPACSKKSLSIISSDIDRLISGIREKADFKFIYKKLIFSIYIDDVLKLTITSDADHSAIEKTISICKVENTVTIYVQYREPLMPGLSNFDHKIIIELTQLFHRWTVDYYMGPITFDFDYEKRISDDKFEDFRDASNENIAEKCSKLSEDFLDKLEKKGV